MRLKQKVCLKDTTIVCIILLLIFAFLPIASSFNGTITNFIKLIICAIFLLKYLSQKKKDTMIVVVLICFPLITNLICYYNAYYTSTTFFHYINKSTLCWAYMAIALYISNGIDEKDKKSIENVLLLITIVTCATTIIGGIHNPMLIRNTIQGGVELADKKQAVARQNIANWGMIYSYSFTMPYWVHMLKKTKKIKYLIVAAAVLSMIIVSEITFALLFSILFLSFLFINPKNMNKLVVWIFVGAVLMIIGYIEIDNILIWLSSVMKSIGMDMLSFRFRQLHNSIALGKMTGTGAARFELYSNSIKSFYKSPLIGFRINHFGYDEIGFHSQLFDMLGASGLLGSLFTIIPFLIVFKRIRKKYREFEQRFIYDCSFVVLILFSIVNPVWGCQGAFFGTFGLLFLSSHDISNNDINAIV